MNQPWIIAAMALAVSACQPGQPKKDSDTEARAAWAKCLFELDKVEAIRGRNLDDLNKGGSVARNQFLMDCLAVEEAGPNAEQLLDMGQYSADWRKRTPSDMSLNNGKR